LPQPSPPVLPTEQSEPSQPNRQPSRSDLRRRQQLAFTRAHRRRPPPADPVQRQRNLIEGEECSITTSEFEHLQQLSGRQFDWDACCNDTGSNAHCKDFSSSKDSFLQCNVSGKHVWLFPPASMAEQAIEHMVDCWKSAPASTSAVIFIPESLSELANSQACQMRLLQKYQQRQRILVTPLTSEEPGKIIRTSRAMHAYSLDALAEEIDLTHEPTTTPLAFVFDAMCYPIDNNKTRRRGAPTLPGIPAAIMGDTGASCRFASLKWCEEHKIPIHKLHANWTVTVANDEEVQVCGYANLEFNIQGYKDTATFLVMPMTTDYDIILGNDWAIARGAIFNFRDKQLAVQKYGKDFVLKPRRLSKTSNPKLHHPEKDTEDDFDTTDPDKFVLNSAQAKRVMRKKLKNCTVIGVDYLGNTAEVNAAKAAAKTTSP
jgi:hypothetical protein